MNDKKILAVLSALLVSAAAFAGDWTDGLSVSVGIGGRPQIATNYLTGNWHYYDVDYNWSTLSGIYRDYRGPIMSTGTVSASATMKLGKKGEAGVDLAFAHLWYDSFNGITDKCTGRTTGAALYLLPCIRFYYLQKPKVRIYMGLEAGVGKYFGFSRLKGWRTNYDGAKYWEDESFKFEAQFVPFGMEIGNDRWFGLIELGGGSLYCGMKLGVGYRF